MACFSFASAKTRSMVSFLMAYLKGGQNAAKLAQRTRYVATRPGVELLADESSTLHTTKKSCSMQMHKQRNKRDDKETAG